jgi:hypothetical protein
MKGANGSPTPNEMFVDERPRPRRGDGIRSGRGNGDEGSDPELPSPLPNSGMTLSRLTPALQTGQSAAPLSNQAQIHFQQYKWPQRVTTGR